MEVVYNVTFQHQIRRLEHLVTSENIEGIYQLQGGQMLLPPDVLLVFRTHGGHHVVEVHDDVHQVVDDVGECAVPTYRH